MVVAFVFARGGSKGVSGKNIKLLAGKPLLAYSIEMAHSIDEIERVFVSTDDEKIAAVAREWNAGVIKRPAELAQDSSSEWLAWQHAVKYVEKHYGRFDTFLSLPTTAPLRSTEDVKNCLAAMTEDIDIVVTTTGTGNNPFFNMVTVDKQGKARLFNTSNKHYVRRQGVPTAYNMTTVAYVTSPKFILQKNGIFDGTVRAVEIPQERAIDIDTETDFIIAQCLVKIKQGNYNEDH